MIVSKFWVLDNGVERIRIRNVTMLGSLKKEKFITKTAIGMHLIKIPCRDTKENIAKCVNSIFVGI